MIAKVNFEDVGGFAFLGGLCKVGEASVKRSSIPDKVREPLMRVLRVSGTLFHGTALYYFMGPQCRGKKAALCNLTGVIVTIGSIVIQFIAEINSANKQHLAVIGSHISLEMVALASLIASSIGVVFSEKHRSVCVTANLVQVPYWAMKFYAEMPHYYERPVVRDPKVPPYLREEKDENVIYLGREREIEDVLDVICADIDNNNVILVGNPGNGKTQMFRYLSAKTRKGELTDLQGSRFFSTTAKDIIAGARYVGAKEERVKEIFRFLRGINERAILFIDEIWQLIGTGIGEGGTTDIAGTLLTEIEGKGVIIIGATTLREGEYLGRNQAFLDRFQLIGLSPLSRDQRIEILQAHIKKYQENGVDIPLDFAQQYVGGDGQGGSLRKDIRNLGVLASRMKRKGISACEAASQKGGAIFEGRASHR